MRLSRGICITLASALVLACSEEPPGKGAENVPASPPLVEGTTARVVPEQKPDTKPDPDLRPADQDPAALAEEGRQVYLSSCIACHNADPTADGALGPAVAGSSLALIEARVMRAEYPQGYTPKRDTRVMIAMPFLANKLPALAAYLASVSPQTGR